MDADAWHKESTRLRAEVNRRRTEYERLNKKSGKRIDADIAWKRWTWAVEKMREHEAKK